MDKKTAKQHLNFLLMVTSELPTTGLTSGKTSFINSTLKHLFEMLEVNTTGASIYPSNKIHITSKRQLIYQFNLENLLIETERTRYRKTDKDGISRSEYFLSRKVRITAQEIYALAYAIAFYEAETTFSVESKIAKVFVLVQNWAGYYDHSLTPVTAMLNKHFEMVVKTFEKEDNVTFEQLGDMISSAIFDTNFSSKFKKKDFSTPNLDIEYIENPIFPARVKGVNV